jgi:steroid delta-isomerase-like uncharacterized protein
MEATTAAAGIDPALREFTQRYMAAWNDLDEKAMAPLLTEDIVWYDPALPEPARGPAGVQQFMRDSWRAFPDLRFSEPDQPHLTATGDLVAWAWRMRGTNSGPIDPPGFAATGKAVDVSGVDLWRMREGRIAHYRALYDMNDLVRQLGIVPAPGSRGERGMVAMQRLGARLRPRGRR